MIGRGDPTGRPYTMKTDSMVTFTLLKGDKLPASNVDKLAAIVYPNETINRRKPEEERKYHAT